MKRWLTKALNAEISANRLVHRPRQISLLYTATTTTKKAPCVSPNTSGLVFSLVMRHLVIRLNLFINQCEAARMRACQLSLHTLQRFRVPGFPERYPAGTQPGANCPTAFVVGCNDTLADEFCFGLSNDMLMANQKMGCWKNISYKTPCGKVGVHVSRAVLQ